ncbi:MATE family efflux transporter [Thiolapillus sp.]|uniref:MATE family efflux transporter n=1 Tax=Thiolapillus sp. TaxID=2017437 RepID=UPI0025FB2B29|nr:MATE family efflux transporter [Thiolapillus sp.]
MNYRAIKKEVRLNARLAGPIVLAQVAQVAMGFTDTVMAGRLGPLDLGAIAVGVNLWILPYLFCVGLLMAISSMTSHYFGAARFAAIRDLMEQMGRVVLVLSVLAVGSIFLMAWGLVFVKLDAGIAAVAASYVRAVSFGLPAIIGYLALRFLSEGIGYTKPMMLIQLVALLANVLANWVFMFGKLGVPAMGAEGAGWATALVMWLQLFLLLGYILRHKRYRFIWITAAEPRDWRKTREMLRVGAPIAVSLVAEVGMFAAVALLMGRLGVTEVAAHQVALNVAAMAFMIPLGISSATTVRVGHAIGEGRARLVRFRGLVGIGFAASCMTLTASVLFLFPEEIVSVYTGDVAVRELAVKLLLMAAIFQLSDGIQISANGALRGMKDTFYPMMITLVVYWLWGLPLSWYLGFSRHIGPQGLWMGLVAGLTLSAIWLVWRFLRLTHRLPAGSVPASD